ncbi:hydrolase [Bifidobacterium actinocoloniiforme DSM 22766]|uniref:Hydrolase n=1 Tax=Bifidobacterium actinocoloniiforme DSM 22766 TaxID=1437605 RepID=A0A086YZN2_9BIFI|nr:alpha/beta hydrolase [Bifidobacterium actinocoloniiforme]AKV55040.1 esterase [Bifidobacterium actinocoloniiforme DSM 22766]KFI39732.1 hydrolase [Bifidobacterium actinocoloniiforme DSM 22766]
MASLPVFVILMGILVSISHLTAVPWKYEPVDQNLVTLTPDTAVAFDNPGHAPMEQVGAYRVSQRYAWVNAKREATGEVQRIHVLVREPIGAAGKRAAVLFMHGAGYGTCDNSFGDVAASMASAGFVTAVIDKPVWSTTDIDRDYPASAKAYDQVANYLRAQSSVDPDKVGIYATSESTWISTYLLEDDPRIAFQILLSPMVYSPRHALGFFVAQDFAIAGSNPGYQSVVRRLFSTDGSLFGLGNLDIRTQSKRAYAVPTLVAYGTKDVMTAQVEGAQKIMAVAHEQGNWDVTVRSYAVSNHVLRLGDEAVAGTPLADHYMRDVVDWTQGQAHGLKQTTEPVAGSTIHQSIAVPLDLYGRRKLTVYMVIVHASAVLFLLASALMAVAAAGVKLYRLLKRDKRLVLGFSHGFGGTLAGIIGSTLAALLLFAAGLGQVIQALVRLGWGGVPDPAGVSDWSWPVIQLVSALVVLAWSWVLVRLYEAATLKGVRRIPAQVRREGFSGAAIARKLKANDSGPVLASSRFGLVFFWTTALAMLSLLLVFAFWGLFIY